MVNATNKKDLCNVTGVPDDVALKNTQGKF